MEAWYDTPSMSIRRRDQPEDRPGEQGGMKMKREKKAYGAFPLRVEMCSNNMRAGEGYLFTSEHADLKKIYDFLTLRVNHRAVVFSTDFQLLMSRLQYP